jgi:flagellar hook-associated protein 1 FlgK
MAGSVNLFNTGKSALFTSRAALATTGHNISNVNTEGYSRQRVEQESANPQKLGNVVFGSGVKISSIQRINDEYLTRQLANETKSLGQYEEKEIALSQADAIFNELNNEGLNRLMSRFFNEFRKLGNEPESEALRATVRESTEQLVGDFHRLSRSIQDIQKNIDVRIESNVRQANELIERIAKLNEEIKRYELHSGQAGDLRDKRDMAIRKLSEILDVSVATDERGSLTLNLEGVGPLVSGTLVNKIYVEKAHADPSVGRPENSYVIRVENIADGGEVTQKIKNSRLGGLIEARDKILGQASRRLDELAYMFAKKVNEIHRLGFNMNGTTGVDFFEEPVQVYGAAQRLSVSEAVKSDFKNIATGLEPDSPGDNRITQLIAKLQHARIMGNGNSTFDDFYNATVADVATVAQKNKQVLEHQTHIVGQLEKLRQSISGVSLDEETMNLVQFQQAFNASAKVIQVADEMLDTILNLKR